MRFKNFLSRQAARVGAILAAGAMLLGLAPATAHAAGNNNIKIFEFFGAGNLSKSEYSQDTMILFNPTQAPITMNNWSIQAINQSSYAVTVYKLPVVTIPAGGYYAITGSAPTYISGSGCTSTDCHTNYAYDYRLETIEKGSTISTTQNIFSSTSYAILLANNQTATTVGVTSTGCTLGSNVVDLLGVGVSPNFTSRSGTAGTETFCFEGAVTAPRQASLTDYAPYQVGDTISTVTYNQGTVRKSKCVDTDNNKDDFTLGHLVFYNSSSPVQPCPTGAQQLSINSVSFTPAVPGATDTVTMTVKLTPATGGGTTKVQIFAPELLNTLSYTTLYDDGAHGDGAANDGTFAGPVTVGNVDVNSYYISVIASDTVGSIARASVPITLQNGYFNLSSTSYTGTVKAGGVIYFPIKVQAAGGYHGYVTLTCSGAPSRTQCVTTPPYATISTVNGSATVSLAIAAGTTIPASTIGRDLPTVLAGILAAMLLAVGIWRRKHLPLAGLLAIISFISLSSMGCETNAGFNNTTTPPGTYTITVTAVDSVDPTITSAINFTVTVQ